MPLTDNAVRDFQPQGKTVRLFDGAGLYLEIAPSCGKWWRLKYRVKGKEKRMTLGVYPAVLLDQVRRECDAAKQLLADGTDAPV